MIASTKSIIAATLIGGTVMGVVCWRIIDRQVPKITNGAIVCDNSGSMADVQDSCIGLADRALKRPKLTNGSIVTVVGLGDGQTGNEPRFVAKYEVPYSRRALEGKGAISRQKALVLADLQGRLERLPRTLRSPIFLAVKRGVEQLRGNRCAADSDCYLFVRTDGEETAEAAIKRALDGQGKLKGLPEPISNEGITVVLCGLSETVESASTETKGRPVHEARRGDRIRDVWLSLFTEPNFVSFEPYCPKSQAELREN